MKLHKHSEKDGVGYCLYSHKKMVWGTASTVIKRWCGVLPLQSYFGPIREESIIRAEVLFAYFLGEHHLAFQLGDHCTKLFKLMFPDSSIAKDFKVVLKQQLC